MPIESVNDGFAEWAETVRDPATKASEGKRFIRAGKDAEACYEVAPLPDGRWTVKVRYAYASGDMSSFGSPWIAFETREDCLAYFLEGARHHFGDRQHISSGAQEKAQKRMAELLSGIVLFVEPKVEAPDPAEAERKKESEARSRAHQEEARRRLKQDLPLFAELLDEEDGEETSV